MMGTIARRVLDELEVLEPSQQQQVLDYARSLSAAPVRGVPGRSLLRFAGSIPAEDLAEIEAAIEEGCERVEPDAW